MSPFIEYLCRHLRADRLQILRRSGRLSVTCSEANIHLLNLVEERLFQVKSFAERFGLNGAERPENSNMSSLDDDAQSAKGGDKQYEDENDGDSASEDGVHDRQVVKWPSKFAKGIGLIRRNGS